MGLPSWLVVHAPSKRHAARSPSVSEGVLRNRCLESRPRSGSGFRPTYGPVPVMTDGELLLRDLRRWRRLGLRLVRVEARIGVQLHAAIELHPGSGWNEPAH